MHTEIKLLGGRTGADGAARDAPPVRPTARQIPTGHRRCYRAKMTSR